MIIYIKLGLGTFNGIINYTSKIENIKNKESIFIGLKNTIKLKKRYWIIYLL